MERRKWSNFRFIAMIPSVLLQGTDAEQVAIDLSGAHIWDISSVAALDMVVLKFRREGAEVELIGLNEASETIVDRLAIHDEPGALDKLQAH